MQIEHIEDIEDIKDTTKDMSDSLIIKTQWIELQTFFHNKL